MTNGPGDAVMYEAGFAAAKREYPGAMPEGSRESPSVRGGCPWEPGVHTPVYIVPPLRGSGPPELPSDGGPKTSRIGAPEGRHFIDRGVNPGLPHYPEFAPFL